MIKCERFDVGEGERYDVEVHGSFGVVMAELTNLCRVVHKNSVPFLPIETFVMVIADAVKKFEPDKVEDNTAPEEADNIQDFTGRENLKMGIRQHRTPKLQNYYTQGGEPC